MRFVWSEFWQVRCCSAQSDASKFAWCTAYEKGYDLSVGEHPANVPDRFLRWRVALMERSVQKLNLASATQPIPNYGDGPDPYQGFQVHDYLQVSFIRQDPRAPPCALLLPYAHHANTTTVVKAASKKTIEVLGRYYPETLSRKFFVNVPVIMGWVYAAMKLVVAKETVKKFTVLSYGNQLAGELGQGIPNVYGGSAGELKDIGEGMKLEG